MNVKTPPILFEEEIKSLLATIEKAVVHSPLAINEIINLIPIVSELSSYGAKTELILSKYLKGMKEKKMREINEAGLNLIKRFEGLRLDAYQCPAKIWTIGYGSTNDVKKGDKISPEMAEKLLRQDLAWACSKVEELIEQPLNDNEFAALVSFTFNCGAHNLKVSTLRRVLNEGHYESVPIQLCRWTKATVDGVKVSLAGLVRRRQAEANLWITPSEVEPDDTEPMVQKVDNIEYNEGIDKEVCP